MIEEITQSAFLGILIVWLGFFIKKWIQCLENKIDRIRNTLDKKIDKEDFHEYTRNLEKKCEKEEHSHEILNQELEKKCDEINFIKHSHTAQGKIILN